MQRSIIKFHNNLEPIQSNLRRVNLYCQTFGPSEVCAQVSVKGQQLTQFCSDEIMSKTEIALIFNSEKSECTVVQCYYVNSSRVSGD